MHAAERSTPSGSSQARQSSTAPCSAAVGTNAENSLIGSYRTLPPLTALRQRQEIGQAGRQSKGPELARFRPFVLPPAALGAAPQLLVNTTAELPHPAHHAFGTRFSTKPTRAARFGCPPSLSGSILRNSFPFYSRRSRSRPAADFELHCTGSARSRNRSSPILRGLAVSTTTTHDVIGATVFGSPQAQPHGRRWPQVIPRRLWRRRARPRPRWTTAPATSRAPSASPKTRTPMATRRI